MGIAVHGEAVIFDQTSMADWRIVGRQDVEDVTQIEFVRGKEMINDWTELLTFIQSGSGKD